MDRQEHMPGMLMPDPFILGKMDHGGDKGVGGVRVGGLRDPGILDFFSFSFFYSKKGRRKKCVE